MTLANMHPEDVKAGLRKRFGSVAEFERQQGLPDKSVHDLLRNRASARVKNAVEGALAKPITPGKVSEFSDSTPAHPDSHCINAEGR